LNRGTIPIIARLQSLQEPARFAPSGARVIADAGTSGQLTALMREVNETILGRALRFDSGNGASLTLEASGRRVLRVTAAQGLPGAETCLAVDVLEDEQKDDLIKLMQELAAPRQELRVTISARGVAGEGVSVGLPVALLADLMLVELNDPTGADETDEPDLAEAEAVAGAEGRAASAVSLARFVQALGPTLMASVIRGGEADGMTEGAEEMVAHLQGFLDDEGDALQEQLDLVSGRPGRPACMVLGTALIDGNGVLCARSEDAILLALFEGSPSQTLLGAWAEARG
jgi:hypothetical protein